MDGIGDSGSVEKSEIFDKCSVGDVSGGERIGDVSRGMFSCGRYSGIGRRVVIDNPKGF